MPVEVGGAASTPSNRRPQPHSEGKPAHVHRSRPSRGTREGYGLHVPTRLEDFAREASLRRGWKIGCGTCGAGELRAGIRHVARGIPLRLFESRSARDRSGQLFDDRSRDELIETSAQEVSLEPVPWRVVLGSPSHPLNEGEAERLSEVCVKADLGGVASAAAFPDWLGYLGMILYELDRFESQRSVIGQSWARQFVSMGGDAREWGRLEHRAMTWSHLALAAHEGLGRRRSLD